MDPNSESRDLNTELRVNTEVNNGPWSQVRGRRPREGHRDTGAVKRKSGEWMEETPEEQEGGEHRKRERR